MRRNIPKKTVCLVIYVFLAVVPIICILANIVLPILVPNDKETALAKNFDFAFTNEIIYFGLFSSAITSIYGFIKLLNLFRDDIDKNRWGDSDNTILAVVLYNIIGFAILSLRYFYVKDVTIVNWYDIALNGLEHGVVPIVIILYFLLKERNEDSDYTTYLYKSFLWILSIPLIYLLIIYSRCVLITKYSVAESTTSVFPIEKVNPFKIKFYYSIAGVTLIMLIIYLVGWALNCLSIKINRKIYGY